MAEKKVDGVVEAVRYTKDGLVKLVRVYLRRGPTWSDRMLLTRDDFVDMLKAGKRFSVGKRVEYMAGTFDLAEPVQVNSLDGSEFLFSRKSADGRDNLEGAPLF